MLSNIERGWSCPELGIQSDGIVLFVFNSQGKVLTIKEKTDKSVTLKKAGEIGVICETRDHSWESNDEVVTRGISEELGVKKEEMKKYFGKNGCTYLGTYPFITGVLAHAYKINCIDPQGLEEKIRKVKENEVEFAGWRDVGQLINPQNNQIVRRGVENVVKLAFNHR